MSPAPRKLKKTYNIAGHAHSLTFSCHARLPLLNRDRVRHWMIESMERSRRDLDFDIWAYVIMPEHLHLLIHPRNPRYDIGKICAALKRPVSSRAKDFLQKAGAVEWINRLTIRRGSRQDFRFWQAGGGYDRNLWTPDVIRSTVDYIHANPVRRGLAQRPGDWYWSSARFWNEGKKDPIAMDPIRL